MKHGSRLLKLFFMGMVISFSAQVALAQLPGPFSFSFAAPFLNALFLAPFALGGCF